MEKILLIKCGIARALMIILISFLLISVVSAFSFRQVYNPFTRQLDYYVSNFSGENISFAYICLDEDNCINMWPYNTSEVDANFSNYYTKVIIDNNFSLYYPKTDVDNNFSLYYLKTDIDNNFSLYYLKSDVDNNLSNYILISSEGDLNVNQSDYWDEMSTTNSTQMEDSGGELNIKESWFTSLWNYLLGLITTDDLTEGTTNRYDNQSWNESRGNVLYLPHTTDTNASSCPDGYYLAGEDLCIHFNKTVEQIMAITYYNATSIDIIVGTNNTGELDLIQTYNINTYNISEATGTPAMDVRINFTGVVDFNQLIIRMKSVSGEKHRYKIQIYDYNLSDWEDYTNFVEVDVFDVIELGVYDADDHISGGLVQVRFYLDEVGSPVHEIFLDWVVLSDGPATFSTDEIDPVSIHVDAINETQMNYTSGKLNILLSWLKSLFYGKSEADDNLSNYVLTTDLSYAVDTSAHVNCSNDEVFLGNGSCLSSSGFGGEDTVWNITGSGYLINDSDVLDLNETALEESDFTFGSLVGFTSGTHNGNLSNASSIGYIRGNLLCNDDYPGSHFCLEVEIMKTNVYNHTFTGEVWMAKGAPGYTAAANDCEGWTKVIEEIGPKWHFDENTGVGSGKLTPCASTLKLACCK